MAYLSLSFVRRAVAAVAVAVVAAAGSARADFVLDDFSAPEASFYQITGSNPNPYTPPPTVLGPVTRTTTITVISGVGPSSATGQYGGGVFEQSTPAASTAISVINYAYASAANYSTSGVGALNVSGFTLAFTFADLGVPYSIQLTDSSNNTSTFTGLVTGAGTSTASLAAFSGGANLSSIASVDVFLNRNILTNSSTTSADFILDTISVTQQAPPAVPAPPAALLALAALPVLGARKMLRKKA